MNNLNTLIEVISFTYPQEAYLAKSLLEASDIEVMIKDELTVQVNNFYSNAIGGVKLLVEASQLEEAQAILKEAGYINDENQACKNKLEVFSDAYKEKCPYCESMNVTKKKLPGYFFIISILLLGFPVPFLKKTIHCFDCNKEWRV